MVSYLGNPISKPLSLVSSCGLHNIPNWLNYVKWLYTLSPIWYSTNERSMLIWIVILFMKKSNWEWSRLQTFIYLNKLRICSQNRSNKIIFYRLLSKLRVLNIHSPTCGRVLAVVKQWQLADPYYMQITSCRAVSFCI